MAKNPDFEFTSDEDLIIRDAELRKAMIAAKQGDDPAAARAAKDELRAFRQFWRGLRELFYGGVNKGDAVGNPDPIAAKAEGN
jgi:hypothetical protein